MEKRGEGSRPDEKQVESRQDFIKYLTDRAGDANYPTPIRKKALELYYELTRYPKANLTRSESGIKKSFVQEHFDRVHAMISDLRQGLIVADLGDSPFAHVLVAVHENIK